MDKRELILLAAKAIFEDKGYHEAKISDIAIKASVGKGTVYGYFDSKQSLFEEMIIYYLEKSHEVMEKITDKDDDSISKLRSVIELEWEISRDHGKLLNVIISRFGNFDSDLKMVFVKAREQNLQMICKIIKQGILNGEFKDVDLRLTALLFKGGFSQLNMDRTFSLKAQIDTNQNAFDDNTEAMFKIFINSIKS